jgi:hypothetical protein
MWVMSRFESAMFFGAVLGLVTVATWAIAGI